MNLRKLVWLPTVAFFLLNPNVGCEGPEYQFGESEMRRAVEGTWQLTLSPTAGTPTEFIFAIEQTTAKAIATRARPSLIRPARACSERSFGKVAEACIDKTQMPVSVMVVKGDPILEGQTLPGSFNVYSMSFHSGHLGFTAGSIHLSASLTPDGNVTKVSTGLPDTTATLVRINP